MIHRELKPDAECDGRLIESGKGVRPVPDGPAVAVQFYKCDTCNAILESEESNAAQARRLVQDLARHFRLRTR